MEEIVELNGRSQQYGDGSDRHTIKRAVVRPFIMI